MEIICSENLPAPNHLSQFSMIKLWGLKKPINYFNKENQINWREPPNLLRLSLEY